MTDYDWPVIEDRRDGGETWPEIAEDYDVTPGTIRKAYSRYQGNAADAPRQHQASGEIADDVEDAVYMVRVVRIR